MLTARAVDSGNYSNITSCESFGWRRTLRDLGGWNEQAHAHFPDPLRAIIATLLIVARSESPHTRMLSRGLSGAYTVALYALFRWIGRLNYFVA